MDKRGKNQYSCSGVFGYINTTLIKHYRAKNGKTVFPNKPPQIVLLCNPTILSLAYSFFDKIKLKIMLHRL